MATAPPAAPSRTLDTVPPDLARARTAEELRSSWQARCNAGSAVSSSSPVSARMPMGGQRGGRNDMLAAGTGCGTGSRTGSVRRMTSTIKGRR